MTTFNLFVVHQIDYTVVICYTNIEKILGG